MKELPNITAVMDPYHDYRRPAHEVIPFGVSFNSLLTQSYPPEKITILLTKIANRTWEESHAFMA